MARSVRFNVRSARVGAAVFTAVGVLLCPAPAGASADDLTADEQQTASVIVAPSLGERIVAHVVPRGCASSECDYIVAASNPGDSTTVPASASRTAAAGGGPVLAQNGARVEVLSSGPAASQPASAPALSAGFVAADPEVFNTTFNGDNICASEGCALWKLVLNSRSYCDRTYAWGTRSRYGHAGYVTTDGTSANGYSLASDSGFNGDPSETDLYAYHSARVTALFNGFPSSHDHYLHRHYYGSCARTYLVGA